MSELQSRRLLPPDSCSTPVLRWLVDCRPALSLPNHWTVKDIRPLSPGCPLRKPLFSFGRTTKMSWLINLGRIKTRLSRLDCKAWLGFREQHHNMNASTHGKLITFAVEPHGQKRGLEWDDDSTRVVFPFPCSHHHCLSCPCPSHPRHRHH